MLIFEEIEDGKTRPNPFIGFRQRTIGDALEEVARMLYSPSNDYVTHDIDVAETEPHGVVKIQTFNYNNELVFYVYSGSFEEIKPLADICFAHYLVTGHASRDFELKMKGDGVRTLRDFEPESEHERVRD